MKRVANMKKASTDDLYYVSAADVADKIIEQMQRGLDPLLFRSSMLAFAPTGSMFSARLRRKLD